MAYLEDDRALKHHQHERRKKRVVPVLVQAPERDAKHLEDEEGCDGVLGKELGEFGDGNVALVGPVRRFELLEVALGGSI